MTQLRPAPRYIAFVAAAMLFAATPAAANKPVYINAGIDNVIRATPLPRELSLPTFVTGFATLRVSDSLAGVSFSLVL